MENGIGKAHLAVFMHCFSFVSVIILLGFSRSNSASDFIVSLAKGPTKIRNCSVE